MVVQMSTSCSKNNWKQYKMSFTTVARMNKTELKKNNYEATPDVG